MRTVLWTELSADTMDWYIEQHENDPNIPLSVQLIIDNLQETTFHPDAVRARINKELLATAELNTGFQGRFTDANPKTNDPVRPK